MSHHIHAGSELRQRALTTLEKKIEVRVFGLTHAMPSCGLLLAGGLQSRVTRKLFTAAFLLPVFLHP